MLSLNTSGKVMNGSLLVEPYYEHKDTKFDKIVRIPNSGSFLLHSGTRVFRGWVTIDGKLDLVSIPNFGSDIVIGNGEYLAFQLDGSVSFHDVGKNITKTCNTSGKCIYYNGDLIVMFQNSEIMMHKSGSSNKISGFDQAIVAHYCVPSKIIWIVAKKDEDVFYIKYNLETKNCYSTKKDYELPGEIVHVVYDAQNRNIVRVVAQNDDKIINGPILHRGKFIHGQSNHVLFQNDSGKLELAY